MKQHTTKYLRNKEDIRYINEDIDLKENGMIEEFRGNWYYVNDLDRDYVVYKNEIWGYKNFKNGESGSFISLIMKLERLFFLDAIDFIIRHDNENTIVRTHKTDKRGRKLEKEMDWDNYIQENKLDNDFGTRRYLTEYRKIDESIVDYFIKKGYIYRHNRDYSELCDQEINKDKTLTMFVFKDPFTGDTTGLMGRENRDYMKYITLENGKKGKPFVRNFSGCKWGFNFLKGEPKKLYIFESSIDLLSYLTIYKGQDKLNDSMFLSTNGTNYKLIKEVIGELDGKGLEDIIVCTDNDISGESTYQLVKALYTKYEVQRDRPKSKDFNDDLRRM